MAEDYRIHINFLPVVGEVPDFRVYRRPRAKPDEQRPTDGDCRAYSLPCSEADAEVRQVYWVRLEAHADYEPFQVKARFNNDLTQWALFRSIASQCAQTLPADRFWLPEKGFLREIHLNMRHHDEGDEQLILQPYFLRVAQEFGVLADFHFRKAPEVKFSRRVQQLSLSLGKDFRRNLDCYVDRFTKITEFLKERWDVLCPINLPEAQSGVALKRDFEALSADRLRSRVYVFGNGRESKSQFTGLKDYGPLQQLSSEPKLLFVFRERDRQAARDLAKSLRGARSRERYSFPGFESLFKTPLQIDANPVVVPDFSVESMKAALERRQHETKMTLSVLVMPDDDDGYLSHKAIFAHEGIPSQVCTLGVIQDENSLKWAVANIALQIFCKTGGRPWTVRATGEKCLIVGISQSHKLRKTEAGAKIERYFAFSVLTDSSGMFQKIQVLGQADDEMTYLERLRASLREVLRSGAEQFSRVVIHTSFKLKHREIDAIQRLVQEVAATVDKAKCRFAVVKVNHKSRFFGANRGINSLVPYEGTRVKLGRSEYLVWFEGIFPDKPTVTKAFPGPTHIQFLRVSDESQISDDVLLQDLINLSGANWRGFNAKSAPVSVFYCHLVADLVHDFHERGLPLPEVENLQPWFL